MAAQLGCSPFHLVRGAAETTCGGIAAQIGAVLHRLAESKEDLARLVLELDSWAPPPDGYVGAGAATSAAGGEAGRARAHVSGSEEGGDFLD